VLAHLEEKDVINITLHVGTFSAVTTAVTVTVVLEPNYLLADVTADVQEAISDYILSRKVGETVHVAGLYDAVYGNVVGVTTLVVNTPSSDQTATSYEKRTPGVITVN
jgi:uncharacterized phage protein gp47/JayE